uniref:ATP-dependent RNA helicase n=1 Tax=Panagrolaimus superbus TaxID=310955 RepID=A0A914Y2F5_9BILA
MSGTPAFSVTRIASGTSASSITPSISVTQDALANYEHITPAATLNFFQFHDIKCYILQAVKQTNETKVCGVKEGNDHKYDSEDIYFAYCYHPIDLHRIKENDNVLYFNDFVKQSYVPRSGTEILDRQIVDNLSKQDIVKMRPVQIAAFQAIFFQISESQKRPSDFLGVSVTGSGKTHAFLVPLVQKCLNHCKESSINVRLTPSVLIFAHTTTLVESIYQKTLELVKDTGLIVRLIAGKTQFIPDTYFHIGICCIGRFGNHLYPGLPGVKIDLSGLKYVVIDEADKMVSLDEFTSLYQKLKEKADFATLLFSATNNSSVKSLLDADNHYTFYYGTPNTVATSIKQKFWHVNSRSFSKVFGALLDEPSVTLWEKDELPHPFDAIYCLLDRDIKKNKSDKRIVIFVKRTALADFIALRLTLYGIPTVSVHSGQRLENRQRFLKYFTDGEVQVMVATNLLTRGTDIQVDYVINYDIPLVYSEFIHRCGRTGRNQQNGVAITCVDFNNHEDYNPEVLQQIVDKEKKLPTFMAKFAENADKLRKLGMEGNENAVRKH